MRWEPEAEALLKRVPFFVRAKVRRKVEEFAKNRGEEVITKEVLLKAKEALREKSSQAEEAFSVEGCFGAAGCPNAVTDSSSLLDHLEEVLLASGLREFLMAKVGGSLKHHHQFRVALSECPNACSQVQIRDFALIGQVRLKVEPERCTFCGECERVCEEGAVFLGPQGPEINHTQCLLCGACARQCPEGALSPLEKGYRVLIGGKLGRHPALAWELVPFAREDEIPDLLKKVLSFYKRHNLKGERLGTIIQRLGWDRTREEILA